MDEAHGSHGATESHTRGHEPSDVNIRLIFVFGLALILLSITIHFALGALMRSFSDQQARSVGASRGLSDILGQSSEPRLQDDPAAELARLRAEEDRKLNTYGWVDREASVVRIPIERAIDLTLTKGLPARPQTSKPSDSNEE